jgi:hypothetical protein
MKGYIGALLEVSLFAGIAYTLREYVLFPLINPVYYYWMCFTVLTGIWEFVYVTCYDSVSRIAESLIRTDEHVWTKEYSICMIIPSRFTRLFYAEYGAHADREYMSRRRGDYWSRLIESSHALCCAMFCLSSLVFLYIDNDEDRYMTALLFGMGCQFMNSLLYMGEYYRQCDDPTNPNHVTNTFPIGNWMSDRPFMWINVLWLLMPLYIGLTCITKADAPDNLVQMLDIAYGGTQYLN